MFVNCFVVCVCVCGLISHECMHVGGGRLRRHVYLSREEQSQLDLTSNHKPCLSGVQSVFLSNLKLTEYVWITI